MTIYDYKRCDV